jgi:NAD(P)-dependent dehydrogenase (short-subunit alcohol dehydrogenase family)
MKHHAVEAFGDLHVVVSNAGILRDRMLVSMSEDDFNVVIDVHLKGTFNVTHHDAGNWRTGPRPPTRATGGIVSTSSGAGLHGKRRTDEPRRRQRRHYRRQRH